MVNASESITWKQPRLALMLLVAAVSVVLLFGVRASAAQACGGGQVCAWTGASFTGSEYYLSCLGGTGVSLVFPESYSAKNNCGGQYYRIGWAEGGVNWKACMGPGGERPNPGRINIYERVGGC